MKEEIMQRQTTQVKKGETVRKWYVVDATDLPLGRLASEVAVTLQGKNKANYTPHVDCGDFVIIINAEKVALTGNKKETKKYYNTSGRQGGLRVRTAGEMIDRYPVEMVERAVWGMLPKGRLGRAIFKKLFVYEGPEHKHAAQQPEELPLRYIGGNK
jgi:large subunit ribosomal protein L13